MQLSCSVLVIYGLYVRGVELTSSPLLLDRQLFGEDEDAVGELDEAEKQGENGKSLFLLYFALCTKHHEHTDLLYFVPISSRNCHPKKRSPGVQDRPRCFAKQKHASTGCRQAGVPKGTIFFISFPSVSSYIGTSLIPHFFFFYLMTGVQRRHQKPAQHERHVEVALAAYPA